MEWIRKHPLETALGGVVALLAVVFLVASLVSSDEPVATTVPIAQDEPTTSAAGGDPDHPAFDPIACSGLITTEDADFAFGVEGQLLSMLEYSGGEVCTDVLADDEDYWVSIEPGSPYDFSDGTEIEGVIGEPVSDVGDDAIWFGGEDVGVISVFDVLDGYALYFRISLSRPDTGPGDELEIVKTLALTALPRFPGAIPDPVVEEEPEQITFETDQVDPALYSYEANLQAGIDAGEWTLGEGLLVTLQVLLGEIEPEQVLRNPALLEQPAWEVLSVAQEYLESTEESDESDEIQFLLGLIAPSHEQLIEEGAIDFEASLEMPGTIAVPVAFQEESSRQSYCQAAFGVDAPCFVEIAIPGLSPEYADKYHLYFPSVTNPWSATSTTEAAEAIARSANLYESIGTMPNVNVYFTPAPGSGVFRKPDLCTVTLGTTSGTGEPFKQRLAVALAYCLIDAAYPERQWWSTGLAWYLSGAVYPAANVEHGFAPTLASEELSTPFPDRRFTNWAFFESLHDSLEPKGNFQLAPSLPGGATDHFHRFKQLLTDNELPDIGSNPDTVPYAPPSKALSIVGPMRIDITPPPWGVLRVHATVPAAQYACVDLIFSSGAITASWRSGFPGGSGNWSEPPTLLEDESVFLVTATGPGSYSVEINRVVDDPEKCEEEIPIFQPIPPDPLCDICIPSTYYWEMHTIHIEG